MGDVSAGIGYRGAGSGPGFGPACPDTRHPIPDTRHPIPASFVKNRSLNAASFASAPEARP